jgi:hypothetical protein
MVVIENEKEPILRIEEKEPLSVRCVFLELDRESKSRVPGWAILGYCIQAKIPCVEMDMVYRAFPEKQASG